MKILDIVFWAFFAFTAAFIAWQFLRLLFEVLRDRTVTRPGSRTSATGGISGQGAEVSSAFTDIGVTSGSDTSASGDSMSGGDSASGEISGGGESGGGGASGGW